MKIAVCDDDREYLNNIEKEIVCSMDKYFYGAYSIETFSSPEKFLEASDRTMYEVIFLDIDMPGITGFETAEELRKINTESIIVFVTNHDEMVFSSWEYTPFFFIRKKHIDDFNLAMSKLIPKLKRLSENNNNIVLKTDNKQIMIDILHTEYIRSDSHYCIFFMEKDNKITERISINEVERQLSDKFFVRIQKSYIVNCRFISKITYSEVILTTGQRFFVGRSKKKNLENTFQDYLRGV